MAQFVGQLFVHLIEDSTDGMWELIGPFGFESEVLGRVVTAPAGFRTDFCSVPRVPGVYDLLGNRARKSGTLHDWLYTCKETTRAEADAVLREMLRFEGIGWLETQMFYSAVRLFGGSHWE